MAISSYLLFLLLLIALILFYAWRLRKADFLIKSHMPIFLKCAFFWATLVAFVCLGFCLLAIDFDLIFSDMNKDGNLTKSAFNFEKELIYLIPLAAIFGAAFGALFSTRVFKGQTNALKRGLVGAGLGLFIFLIFGAVLYFGPANVGNDFAGSGYGSGLLFYMVLIASSLVPIFITLALLTPKQILRKK